MRSVYSKDKFFQKMKKKPELKEVLDKIDQYSDEQIDALTGTHFPFWIKEQLKKLNKRGGKSSEQIAEEIAAKMIAASSADKL
jgi:hypothetical protein